MGSNHIQFNHVIFLIILLGNRRCETKWGWTGGEFDFVCRIEKLTCTHYLKYTRIQGVGSRKKLIKLNSFSKRWVLDLKLIETKNRSAVELHP